MAFIIFKRRGDYQIKKMLLLDQKGKVMVHRNNENLISEDPGGLKSKKLLPDIKQLIKQSGFYKRIDNEKSKPQIKIFRYKEHNILIKYNQETFLVVVYSGSAGLKQKLRTSTLRTDLNIIYSQMIEDWDGDMSELEELDILIDRALVDFKE